MWQMWIRPQQGPSQKTSAVCEYWTTTTHRIFWKVIDQESVYDLRKVKENIRIWHQRSFLNRDKWYHFPIGLSRHVSGANGKYKEITVFFINKLVMIISFSYVNQKFDATQTLSINFTPILPSLMPPSINDVNTESASPRPAVVLCSVNSVCPLSANSWIQMFWWTQVSVNMWTQQYLIWPCLANVEIPSSPFYFPLTGH